MVSRTFIALIFLTCLHLSLSQFACPPAALLEPCTCDSDANIYCSGPGYIDHDHLHRVFEMLRTVNLVTEFHWMNVSSFTLTSTNITTLDTRFLANHTSFTHLNIVNNPNMVNVTLISGPWPWRAAATNLNLSSNAFEKDGLYGFLSLLGDSVLSIDLSYNQIFGFEGREIVGGLPLLSNLEWLNLSNNFLTTLSSTAFYHNSRLQNLDLSNNKIGHVGQKSFEFETADVDLLEVTLTINLNGNSLTDGGLNADSGLATVGRPLIVHVQNNNFIILSAANFETFLFVNFDNLLYTGGNPFVCDTRMKWRAQGCKGIVGSKSRLSELFE